MQVSLSYRNHYAFRICDFLCFLFHRHTSNHWVHWITGTQKTTRKYTPHFTHADDYNWFFHDLTCDIKYFVLLESGQYNNDKKQFIEALTTRP
jgi:hypothetical protein